MSVRDLSDQNFTKEPKKVNVDGIPGYYTEHHRRVQDVVQNDYCRKNNETNPDVGRDIGVRIMRLLDELFTNHQVPAYPHIIPNEMQNMHNLGYDVFHRFDDFNECGVVYRFDLIIVRGKSYLRFIRDDQATQDILEKRLAGLYGNLKSAETNHIVTEIEDILEKHSKNTINILQEMFGEDNDKVLAAAKALSAGPDITRYSPVDKKQPKKPSFYDNPHCVSILAEQYFVRVSELGLLIAL